MILCYDTETSGFALFNKPISDPGQPQLVQMACMLIDDEGKSAASVSMIVKPEGWTIPPKVAEIHGITTEYATQVGLPLRVVVACFTNLRAIAQATAAHNDEFDQIVMAAAIHRVGAKPSSPGPERKICTMKETAKLVNLPATPKMLMAGYTKNKPPKLIELHQFLFGEGFEGAHDALNDVKACARCLIHLRKEHGLCL